MWRLRLIGLAWLTTLTAGEFAAQSVPGGMGTPVGADTVTVSAAAPQAGAEVTRDPAVLTVSGDRALLATVPAFGAASLTPAANRLPGVRLETRAPGSYRLSLRSTARRSPFGVRDVRVYWNELPLTQPGGETPLNFLELANVDELNVGKGPFDVSSGSPLGGTASLRTADSPGSWAAARRAAVFR